MMRFNAQRLINLVGTKALVIPLEGWRAHSFRLHGAAMIRTLRRVALITQRQQLGEIVRVTTQQFSAQLAEIMKRFHARATFGHHGRSVKASVDIFTSVHEELLRGIIKEVLEETGERATVRILPGIQSTLAQGYSKTSILLSQKPDPDANQGLQRRARELAQRVTNLSETTKKRLDTVLQQAVKEKLTITETATEINSKIPKIQAARAVTIARTELNNAWTEGSVQAFKESSTITLVSVIGCESREVDRWDSPSYQQYMYRGESTCNIQDVPVADSDKLEFHPNHTGTMIPTGFIE